MAMYYCLYLVLDFKVVVCLSMCVRNCIVKYFSIYLGYLQVEFGDYNDLLAMFYFMCLLYCRNIAT